MGGGGFMQHASDTNRKDRAQKAARREKFSGNHSDKTLLNDSSSSKLDFSHLTKEQIATERLRLKEMFSKRKRRSFTLGIVLFSLVTLLIILAYTYIRN